jgi:hypothetical protein
MKAINEAILRKMILSTSSPPSDEIAFLHALLNHHMGPDDVDQLPMDSSPGARNFGPRTKAKVQRFQDANNIDKDNKRSFKDGIVGPHTWDVLLEKHQVIVKVITAPKLKLPPFPGPVPRPTPPVIPVPKLILNAQLQVGEQITVPTDGSKVSAQHTIQLTAVILNKNDKDRPHVEGQLGPQITIDSNTGETDFAFVAALVANNLAIPGPVVWSFQAQAALSQSASKPSTSAQAAGIVQANLTIKKNKNGDDVLQLTGQVGAVANAELPNRNNGDKWRITAAFTGFLGLTVTYNELIPGFF